LTLCSPRRTPIARGTALTATWAVEEVAAVAPTASFRDEDRRHTLNRLGGAEQLDASRRRGLLFRRDNPKDRDPIDLDFGLDAQDISDLCVVGKHLRVDDALRLACPGGAPREAAVTPDAGQFDVETVRHAPVKLQAAAEFAKWNSREG